MLRTQQGYLIDVGHLISVIWGDLFRQEANQDFSVGEAWIALLAFLARLPAAADAQGQSQRGGAVNDQIIFDNVSKFYGDVLGVNRVHLSIPPGITSLVGPNGSGKTTLMNLMTGLIRPSRGRITILGMTPDQPEQLFRKVGYSSQFDSSPKGLTGYQFIYSYLLLFGYDAAQM